MRGEPEFDWRTIGALNTVSAMAQVGQFGIAFVMRPVWLAEDGLDATQLGMFAASLWLGQLPGLGVAPRLCQLLGERWVIVSGLLCTISAFFWIALFGWPFWLLGGFITAFLTLALIASATTSSGSMAGNAPVPSVVQLATFKT